MGMVKSLDWDSSDISKGTPYISSFSRNTTATHNRLQRWHFIYRERLAQTSGGSLRCSLVRCWDRVNTSVSPWWMVPSNVTKTADDHFDSLWSQLQLHWNYSTFSMLLETGTATSKHKARVSSHAVLWEVLPGLSSLMADFRRPLASSEFQGLTTFRPGQWEYLQKRHTDTLNYCHHH